MSAVAIARSSLTTSWLRYRRSWGLWLLLLVAPVGARYMIGREDGSGITITINEHMPVITSAFVGVSLGIIVSTLLLPIGFLYLRSNTNRRQPWQIEEVSPASRVAIALGRFGADVLLLFGVLVALNLAGWVLGWVILGPAQLSLWQISFALWLVAGPAVMGLAALRILFDALPWLRRGLGEFAYFVLWMGSITATVLADGRAPGLGANMFDFPGFLQPLKYGAPGGSSDFGIGGVEALPGRIPLDVMAGLLSPGYIGARLLWCAIAVLVAALAGLVYRPHRAAVRIRLTGRFAKWLQPGPPPAADMQAPPARRTALPLAGLVAAEFRLIGAGRLFKLLAVAAGIFGLGMDYRHNGSAAALLLLIFAACAHAGRSETSGLRALTATAPLPPWLRRGAFIVATLGWGLLIALPGALWNAEIARVALAAVTTAMVAVVAITLATVSGSGFAPRLVLLIVWYGYLST